LTLAGVMALLELSAFRLSRHSLVALEAITTTRERLPLASITTLGIFFCFLTGNIGLWVLLERFGGSLPSPRPKWAWCSRY